MLSVFLIRLSSLPLALIQPVGQASPLDWTIDKDVVHVGGCVAIMITQPSRQLGKLRVRIDDGESISLIDEMGPSIRRQDATLVLVSHDLFSGHRVQNVPGDPSSVRLLPVFSEPGTVRITLTRRDVDLGTRTVTVVPAPREASEALELLYPTLKRNRKGDPLDSRWVRAPSIALSSSREKEAKEYLPLLRAELQVFEHHPDWREVMPMLVARIETDLHVRQFGRQVSVNEVAGAARVDLPDVPSEVTFAAQRKLTNPFALAIQDSIRRSLESREILLRHTEKAAGMDE